ncbi:MAG: enoyl-CoA hydratase/isomerase family protein [Gemmatimonadetes bacterium]|nr:enoyl-CoA hydratase/isomerase family protein [Gemmatimonadota bacterium]
MSQEWVHLTQTGGVARVALDRPPLNVLHLAMLEELDRTLAAVDADESVRVVVLEGRGRGFCAGVDVADHTAERIGKALPAFHGVVRRLLDFSVPVVAAVHGSVLGGGLELVLACDLVLAAESARLGQPEIRLGVFPPAAAVLLPRLIGRQHALELILTGRLLSAAEARELGLVGRVYPVDELRERVDELVGELAGSSRPVLRLAKRVVRKSLAAPVEVALERAESVYLDELMRLADAHEGITAFLEKRRPVWRHG